VSQGISLKQAEKRVFATTFQDGLWDVFGGCFILLFALAPFLSTTGLGDFWSSFVFLPFWAAVYLAIRSIRKRVVAPRVGVVRFGPFRKAKLWRFAVLALIVNVAGLVIGFLAARSSSRSGWTVLMPFAALVLTMFSAAAYFLDCPRLYVYGVMVATAPLVGEWLYVTLGARHHGFPITFGTASGLMIGVGLIKFARLLRDHPVPGPHTSSVEP
jgi:hypothetical protein